MEWIIECSTWKHWSSLFNPLHLGCSLTTHVWPHTRTAKILKNERLAPPSADGAAGSVWWGGSGTCGFQKPPESQWAESQTYPPPLAVPRGKEGHLLTLCPTPSYPKRWARRHHQHRHSPAAQTALTARWTTGEDGNTESLPRYWWAVHTTSGQIGQTDSLHFRGLSW